MGKHSNKKKKTKIVLKNPKRLLLFLTIISILIISIIVNNNKLKKDFELSLLINNQDVTKQLQNELIIKEKDVFLSFEDIKKFLDTNIYLEGKNILMSSDKKIAVLSIDSNKLEINDAVIEISAKAFKDEKNIVYLPISNLKNVYDIDFTYVPEYKNIIIDNFSKRLEKANVSKDISIREEKSDTSLIIEKIKKDSSVVFIHEENGWAKVRTQNGNIGYVKKKYLNNFEVERDEFKQDTKNSLGKSIEVDITNKNLKNYKNRKNIIDELLIKAVSQNKRTVKIHYKKSKDNEKYKRLVLEATAILKESGITVEEGEF